MITCPRCGFQAPDGTPWCPRCGYGCPYPVPYQQQPYQRPPQQTPVQYQSQPIPAQYDVVDVPPQEEKEETARMHYCNIDIFGCYYFGFICYCYCCYRESNNIRCN